MRLPICWISSKQKFQPPCMNTWMQQPLVIPLKQKGLNFLLKCKRRGVIFYKARRKKSVHLSIIKNLNPFEAMTVCKFFNLFASRRRRDTFTHLHICTFSHFLQVLSDQVSLPLCFCQIQRSM